ncbi:MAG: linearmycin/streptolysin transport system permease protein [Thermoanaerobaculia bacterium]|jgi:ABC-2 type transport system permease protein|nr:linearmycin/streptolysin transport system permease protein [Thermoanaerobaculia bacterium]
MIVSVVRAGWLNLRRDRAALMLSFIVPIVFFSIFAGIFGAQKSKMPKTTVVIADLDRSDGSRRLIDALKHESALEVVTTPPKSTTPFDAQSAEAFIRAGDAPVALVIPKGFGTTKIQFGTSNSNAPAFRLLADSADPIADQVVGGLLQKNMMMSMPEMMMDAGVTEVDRWSGGLTAQQKAAIDQNMKSYRTFSARPTNSTASSDSLIRIDKTDVIGQNKSNVVAALYAAGIGVMFLLFTASNAGGALLEENESGTLDRILTTRLTLTQLLLGKLAYLWTLGFTQICVMFLWGAFVFRLQLFQHIAGFLIMALSTSLATSAFGLLLAGICRSRAQLAALSTLVVLSLSAIGGSMFPRFLMPAGLQKAGLVLFNSWALEGFTNVFWRELPLSSLALPAAVLVGWAIVFFIASRQLTKRWEIA